ncbi:MAG: hypothetical protein IT379_37330 [Deltaproteobacteria bacterium]|nr:hypothetical protein [Deltaproteobacteria bacterium]
MTLEDEIRALGATTATLSLREGRYSAILYGRGWGPVCGIGPTMREALDDARSQIDGAQRCQTESCGRPYEVSLRDGGGRFCTTCALGLAVAAAKASAA